MGCGASNNASGGGVRATIKSAVSRPNFDSLTQGLSTRSVAFRDLEKAFKERDTKGNGGLDMDELSTLIREDVLKHAKIPAAAAVLFTEPVVEVFRYQSIKANVKGPMDFHAFVWYLSVLMDPPRMKKKVKPEVVFVCSLFSDGADGAYVAEAVEALEAALPLCVPTMISSNATRATKQLAELAEEVKAQGMSAGEGGGGSVKREELSALFRKYPDCWQPIVEVYKALKSSSDACKEVVKRAYEAGRGKEFQGLGGYKSKRFLKSASIAVADDVQIGSVKRHGASVNVGHADKKHAGGRPVTPTRGKGPGKGAGGSASIPATPKTPH